MKNYILLVILLFSCTNFYSQKIDFDENKIKNLISIWGLLKYKHPNISRGNFDFDQEFIKEYIKIRDIKTQEEINTEFKIWISYFNSKKEKIKSKQSQELFTKNEDYNWITNSNFDNDLIKILSDIRNNENYGDHYAKVSKLSSIPDFNNDKEFITFDEKKEAHRVLFLASFWNKMRYWNVNIYLTDVKWNEVLIKMIPEFLKKNKANFRNSKDMLFASLNDSHSNYNYSPMYTDTTRKYSLYGGRLINDTLVIKTVFNKNLAQKENIELGDMIYAINGKNLSTYFNEVFASTVSSSNSNYLRSFIERFYLLSNSADSLEIALLKKNGITRNQKIKLYKYSKNNYQPNSISDTLAAIKWTKIKNNIGYINLKIIHKTELKKVFLKFKNAKGIIIDLRNYPRNINSSDIPYFLYPKKKVFIKVLTSYKPGLGKYDAQTALKMIKNPFAAGRNNKDYFKGKVVLLVDRNTGSMAEYFGMAIQASPNCTTIGEQTFGAVMNRSEVVLKDKTKIDYTSMGAFYPDNISAQRQGLKIDYTVKESAKQFNIYRYINEAVKIIEEK